MIRNLKIGKRTANTGAMDFSDLCDAPAGKHGFVQVKNGHFYFEDGTRARFMGFNFPVRSNFPDHAAAEILSARLASMGVNVVRVTGTDAVATPFGWSLNPESPLIDYEKGNSRCFSDAGWDRLDYWLYQLKEKGIYLHIDLLVARDFLEGDELDYPGRLRATKSCSHINERLIALQKEFATQYLRHVNPYTGLALIDDPAVMGIQVTNEDSLFFWAKNFFGASGVESYRRETQERFNHYLLAKYHTREDLVKAWTFEGVCALGDDEDPAEGSVRCIEIGEYFQPMNEPLGRWDSPEGPARYADYAEFGIMINRKYYGQMLDHIRSLGSRVPLATSCLLTGAADIYSHADGDFMENNAYFNHPAPGHERKGFRVPYFREYITTDPRRASYADFEPRSNLVTQGSAARVAGKPFVMSEWNEYGAQPFHSSAFLMTAAYACLQDWDGLIIYCYHSDDSLDGQPEDEIAHIMDAYNDPSLILQFGTMAAVFLRGLLRPGRHAVDVVYHHNDLLTQPAGHRLPFSVLPFLTQVRCVYQDQGNGYNGGADVAVSAGFVSGGNYDSAAHAVVYARSPYRDAFRTSYAGGAYLEHYKEKDARVIGDGVTLGGRFLVFDDIAGLTADFDYMGFARSLDTALKEWGVLAPGQGLAESTAMVSDTGEIIYSPAEAYFAFDSEQCAFFTGKPRREIDLGERYRVSSRNERISLALLSLDGRALADSEHLLLTALGRSGMDRTEFVKEDEEMTHILLKGKLYLDTLEGSLRIADCGKARLWALDVYGRRCAELSGEGRGDGALYFTFDGNSFGNFELVLS